eukprot:1508576-Pleurochrysis_carterae.AAC.2
MSWAICHRIDAIVRVPTETDRDERRNLQRRDNLWVEAKRKGRGILFAYIDASAYDFESERDDLARGDASASEYDARVVKMLQRTLIHRTDMSDSFKDACYACTQFIVPHCFLYAFQAVTCR